MITFDGVIFNSRNKLGGVNVYFRELLRRAAQVEKIQVIVHDVNIKPLELQIAPEQLDLRRARLFERYRSLPNVSDGILHSSYYRTSRQPGVLNVTTVYDFIYEKFTTGFRSPVHFWQKRDAIMRSDAVICISINTKRDLKVHVPEYPEEKIFITHLAASEHFKPLAGMEPTITTQPYVLFVGGRAGYKNFFTAVEAVSLIGNIALICVGGGAITPQERALLDGTLSGRYFHAGPVETAQLNQLYNAAVCLLYPSVYEGFGIPPLEAMQAGCPVVALNRSSIPEVTGEAGILVDDSDPQLIAAAVNECMSADRRQKMRSLGFDQAAKFSWDKTFNETHAIYRQLLEGSLA
jgi:mannosyltransferase